MLVDGCLGGREPHETLAQCHRSIRAAAAEHQRSIQTTILATSAMFRRCPWWLSSRHASDVMIEQIDRAASLEFSLKRRARVQRVATCVLIRVVVIAAA